MNTCSLRGRMKKGREWWWPRCDRCGRWMRFEEMQRDPDDPRYPVIRHPACGVVNPVDNR